MQFDVDLLTKAENDLLEISLSRSDWTPWLDTVRAATGARGTNIMPIVGRAPSIPCGSDMEAPIEAYFAEGWSDRDYRLKGIHLFRTQNVVVDSDFMGADEYNDEYFRFLSQWKARYAALVGFQVGADVLCCAIHRAPDQGPFTREDGQRLTGLSNRLTLAGSISRAISDARVGGVSDGFDLMSIPAIFFDGNGRVVRLNAAAEVLAATQFQVSNGELRVRSSSDTTALRRRLQATLRGRPGAAEAISVTREGMRPLIFRFQKINGDLQDYFSNVKAMAIITDLAAITLPSAEIIQRTMGLTASEAAIAALIARGADLREVAKARSISHETARTHFKSLAQKLGVRRQSEVASLLARIL